MIIYKTDDEIEGIKKSCRLAADVLDFIEEHVVEDTSTEEINTLCHDYIVEHDAVPSPLNYKGFPKSICTSVNEVVCHGIPGSYQLRQGDIVNIDVTAYLNGFHGDTSRTFMLGKCSRAARELVKHSLEALWLGIQAIRPGGRIGDIGAAVQEYVEDQGYTIVREYCGHGIGRNFHEDPAVVHYGRRGQGAEIRPGMVFTVEPMVNQGSREVRLLDDDWTVETADRKLSAQFEHTVAVRKDAVEILTLGKNDSRPNRIEF